MPLMSEFQLWRMVVWGDFDHLPSDIFNFERGITCRLGLMVVYMQ